jgi:hypothetical protein
MHAEAFRATVGRVDMEDPARQATATGLLHVVLSHDREPVPCPTASRRAWDPPSVVAAAWDVTARVALTIPRAREFRMAYLTLGKLAIFPSTAMPTNDG